MADFIRHASLFSGGAIHADPAYYTGCNIVFQMFLGSSCGKLCGECGKPFVLVGENYFYVESYIHERCILPENNK
jgi:hypothetical protein